jgi:hypothetical protein
MSPDSNPSSNSSEAPILEKRFESRRHLSDLVRAIELSLVNSGLVPYVRTDVSPRDISIELHTGVMIAIRALGSYHLQLTVSARRSQEKAFGVALVAIRAVRGLREKKPIDTQGRGRPRVSRPESAGYLAQLNRLGITTVTPTNSLEEFLRILSTHPFSRLQFVAPERVLRQASDCVFRNPVLLAERVTDILLRSLEACPHCGHLALYGVIPGFRPNLSETQLNQFREDYTTRYKDQVYVGRLHLTIGVSHSKGRCASIHWSFENGLLILTRIGTHGRNAHS